MSEDKFVNIDDNKRIYQSIDVRKKYVGDCFNK